MEIIKLGAEAGEKIGVIVAVMVGVKVELIEDVGVGEAVGVLEGV